MNSESNQPKRIVWNEDLINSFWNGVSSSPMDNLSFGKNAGLELFKTVKKHIPEDGIILDYGCGGGDFLKILLDHGYKSAAFDPAFARSEKVLQNLNSYNNFLGFIEEGNKLQFDVIFLVEVIEHLLPEHFDKVVDRVNALIKAGGILIVTTPNSEDLDDNLCFCPKCAHLFHRWQHINSLSINSLTNHFVKKGFQNVAYYMTDFSSSAKALNAWKLLNNMFPNDLLDKTEDSSLFILSRFKRIFHAIISKLRIANACGEISKKIDDYPQPGECYGNGSTLIYVGRKTL